MSSTQSQSNAIEEAKKMNSARDKQRCQTIDNSASVSSSIFQVWHRTKGVSGASAVLNINFFGFRVAQWLKIRDVAYLVIVCRSLFWKNLGR